MTALALILAAGMAAADDPAMSTDPAETETGIVDDPGDVTAGEDDGWVTIDFGCYDCGQPTDPGDPTDTGDSGSGGGEGEIVITVTDDTGSDPVVEEPVLADPGTETPFEPIYMVADGAPRDSDGVIAPNEGDPVALPTSVCGGCEAEGGLPLLPTGEADGLSRHAAAVVQGNICTDPVTYAAWLCAWQGFDRP